MKRKRLYKTAKSIMHDPKEQQNMAPPYPSRAHL